jgi:hypothetical protein
MKMQDEMPCGVGRELMGMTDDWVQLCERDPSHVLLIKHDDGCEHSLYLCCHHFHQLPEDAMEPEFDPSLN